MNVITYETSKWKTFMNEYIRITNSVKTVGELKALLCMFEDDDAVQFLSEVHRLIIPATVEIGRGIEETQDVLTIIVQE